MLLLTATSAHALPPKQTNAQAEGTLSVEREAATPLPVQPSAAKSVQPAQSLVLPLPVPPAVIATSTAPGMAPILQPMAPPPPPLGSELRGKIREDEQHFAAKTAAARRDFDLRQAEEKKEFEAVPRDAGFWETHRLMRQFRADQAKRRREFNEEQEQKRKTYEWRFP